MSTRRPMTTPSPRMILPPAIRAPSPIETFSPRTRSSASSEYPMAHLPDLPDDLERLRVRDLDLVSSDGRQAFRVLRRGAVVRLPLLGLELGDGAHLHPELVLRELHEQPEGGLCPHDVSGEIVPIDGGGLPERPEGLRRDGRVVLVDVLGARGEHRVRAVPLPPVDQGLEDFLPLLRERPGLERMQ